MGEVDAGMKEAEKRWEDLKKAACAGCRGWCCYRFSMRLIVKKNGDPDWEVMSKQDPELEDSYRFMKENFVRVRKMPRLGSFDDTADSKNVTLTCKAYDMEKGICTRHDERPVCCKSYHCGSPESPTPTGEFWKSARLQARAMKRRGIDWRKLPPVAAKE